ncbi:MAG: hypothetical protein JNG83_13965 [Opitutaceae bacterium]|nr:hypothetical protein [Opitutaceae bacterium]
MKLLRSTLLLVSLAVLLVPSLSAADRASVQAILLTASNEQGESDRRLSAYEPTLRRILRFQSYRFVGQGSASVAVPGSGDVSLGRGHHLEVEAERSDGRSLHVKVRWIGEGRTFMNTGLVLRPGVPAVLGGPSTGREDEVYAVIVIGR